MVRRAETHDESIPTSRAPSRYRHGPVHVYSSSFFGVEVLVLPRRVLGVDRRAPACRGPVAGVLVFGDATFSTVPDA
jgi:hypothetical protein